MELKYIFLMVKCSHIKIIHHLIVFWALEIAQFRRISIVMQLDKYCCIPDIMKIQEEIMWL